LASEEITRPGYWHNTLAYFQDNRELSPVWKDLDWADGHHAEFVSPPVVSSLLLTDGRSISHHRSLDDAVSSVAKFSRKDADAWRTAHERFGNSSEYLIPVYYTRPQNTADATKARREPAGKSSNVYGN
jgi:phytoene dehydrogenase-like protein